MSVADSVIAWVQQTILLLGYGGIMFLMVLESIILPLPSEIILPIAGYLVAIGELNFWLVVGAATAGSVIGSLISYEIGRVGGRPFLQRYGKYFLLEGKRLRTADRWFRRHGESTVLICRLLPLTRYVISIPAGIARMERRTFLLYTFIGAAIWNAAFTYAGVALRENWLVLLEHAAVIEAIFLTILITVVVWYIIKAIDRRTKFLARIAKNPTVKENLQSVRKGIRDAQRAGKEGFDRIVNPVQRRKR